MSIYRKSILQVLEDLFFPSVCEGCNEVGSYLCDRCINKFIDIRKVQECHICKQVVSDGLVHKKCKAKTHLDGVFVIAEYSKFIESYIGDIKYEFYFAMIPDLVKLINRSLEFNQYFRKLVQNSIFTFVPLYPSRKRWRGFNQAERIAQGMAKYWEKGCMKLVKRREKTESQVGLKRKERLKNLRGAFEFIASTCELEDRNVIVVDDVMTSGGTLEECAKTLKAGGCRRVYGLVFARG